MIEVLLAKLQEVVVTESKYDSYGSITIDRDLMLHLGVRPYQKCVINGKSSRNNITYVIPGESGSGVIGCNGALSEEYNVGDKIHVLFFGVISYTEHHKPKIALTDVNNKFTEYLI